MLFKCHNFVGRKKNHFFEISIILCRKNTDDENKVCIIYTI